MELREWLIILGLALVSLIVVDGVRRLQRQRRVPRLDQAVNDLPPVKPEELDDEAREAEINWELPNGGARVVKPADYSRLANKPKLERQEHPGPSKVLHEFKRSFAKSDEKPAATAPPLASVATQSTVAPPTLNAAAKEEPRLHVDATASRSADSTEQTVTEKTVNSAPAHTAGAPLDAASSLKTASNAPSQEAALDTTDTQPTEQTSSQTTQDPQAPTPVEPVLRAEPEDAVFAKHANEAPKRRQLRSDTVGEWDDDDVDEYRLVDFEGIGRSFKRRLIERRKQKAIKKAEKAQRAEARAKQKAERKALEAEQKREAKEAAEAEKARIAQERAEAREAAARAAQAARAPAAHDQNAERNAATAPYGDASGYDEPAQYGDQPDVHSAQAYAAHHGVVHNHPTLEKALRHHVNSERAKEALTNADEMVVISVLARDSEGFEGCKLLELIMACGLRFSPDMGVFHRFETESADSELQFSMVNVLKPGTFPIEEMDEFVTPGITFLMPLPGAEDSAAAFEAMVETAMVLVRHLGGELKDENHSVMTAQTIEFARQRVHEFERRHRLQQQLQAR